MLTSRLQKDALFTPEGEVGGSDHASSAGYVNPLAGVALLSAIDTCNGKPVPSSLGVLEATRALFVELPEKPLPGVS